MNNPPTASASFDRKYMRKGKHSVVLLLPETYHAPIGLVIAYWGNFETAFNSCLAGLIDGEVASGSVRDTKDWQFRRFSSRRRLFKEITHDWLSTWRPEDAQSLANMCDTAGDLSWKRNMIAHGNFAYTIPAHSSFATNCRAIDEVRQAEFAFDESVLKKLYHDISHLTADMVLTFQNFGKVEGPFHALPDTEILRAYRETSHPWNPNPDKRTPPP